MPEPQVLVVADDLTGAMDSASRFASRGFETSVRLGSDEADGADVVVVDTDSRYVTPAEARERVRSAVRNHSAHLVYKKVDSTIRGNVVAETEAALAATGADGVVVAPAFPSEGRITVGGYHLAGGRPVTETATGADPEQAAPTSHLPTLFNHVDATVVSIPIDEMTSATDIRMRFRSELDTANRPVVFACDATTGDHLARLADAVAAVDNSLVYIGSAGLAGYVTVGGSDVAGVLGVVGSANERTLRQLEAVADDRVAIIDPDELVNSPEGAVDSTVDRLADILAEHPFAVVTAAESRSDVESTLEAGRAAGLSNGETRSRVTAVLGDVTNAMSARADLKGLFVTGGAVARHALGELDVTSVSLTQRVVATGVPVGEIRGGTLAGTSVITKAGAFGERELIFKCLAHLARRDG